MLTREEFRWDIDSFGRTAVGVDGRSIGNLRSANLDTFTCLLNIVLATASIPPSIRAASTVLTPKVSSSMTPGEYRPITISSVVLRTLHKVVMRSLNDEKLISEWQKEFVAEDGCGINLMTLQTLIARAK